MNQSKRLLARLHTLYVELFVPKPFCTDCKEQMEYKGRITQAVSVNDLLPKTAALCFRCDEDSYEIWIYKNGKYRSFYAEEE